MLGGLRHWIVCGLLLGVAGGGRLYATPAPEAVHSTLLLGGPFVCRTWRVEENLPHNTVTALAQTRDGYLWVGTANGLARFDGVQFARFGLRDGLPGLFIKALLEDREGALWVGTVNGLSRYQNGVFTTWRPPEGLAGSVILALDEDAEGTIWIATNTGLSRWRRGVFETVDDDRIARRYVPAVTADRHGGVWVTVSGQELLRWDGTDFAPSANLPPSASSSTMRILHDREGRIWAGTTGVLWCFERGTWKSYGLMEGLPPVPVSSLGEDTDGRIWVGTSGEGLFYLQHGRFHRVSPEEGLSDTAIITLASDREGNVWVGTRAGGLNRLKVRSVFVWCHREDDMEVPPMSLAEAGAGSLWVAAQGHGIYRLRQAGNEWSVETFLAAALPYGPILTTRDGSLWLGAATHLQQWREGVPVTSANRPELRGDSVRCLCEDREGGLWVATRDGRVLFLRDDVFTAFTNGLPRGMMTALVQQQDGTVWVGAYGGGLGRLQNGVGTTFGRAQGLASDLIRDLYLDSREHLWIGTEGGGLSGFKDGVLRSFQSQHGIGDDTVVQILEDDAGDLWLGTYRGIYRIRRADLDALWAGRTTRVQSRAFDQSDGLLSAQCVAGFNAALKTRDGQLFFSTDRELVMIDPRRIHESAGVPAVQLERLVVNGQSWLIPAASENRSPAGGSEWRIPPGPQRIEFHYTALYFTAPERVRFRYRLAGLNAAWTEVGAQRVVQFSYLPPGHYRFEVAAHTGDGRWSEPGPGLPLLVLPHFWETWWFRVLLWLAGMGLAAGAGIAVWRRRHARRLQALERQRAVGRERARIARDMHDELGSRLTKAGMVARDLESPGAARQLETLRRTLDDMTVTMDELVWAVNPRHDTLDGLANYMLRFTQEFFAGTPMRCELNIPPDLPAAPLSSAIRHNLFLAFKEALNNIAKHARASTLIVRMQFVAGQLQIEVEDDGAGFAPDHPPSRGRGLENMSNRLRTIGGRCVVASHPGQGTRVRFEMPLRN